MRRDGEETAEMPELGASNCLDFSGTAELERGSLLADRFLIIERCGAGGSGVVYAALDTKVGQKIAIKVLHAGLGDRTDWERLRREVRAARSGHPKVVKVFDIHEHGGRLFLSMELVSGRSLRDELADQTQLPWQEVVAIGRQVAEGLAHLHASGLVHRDVKPGNILLTSEETAKLCDMGLTRPVGHGSTVTKTAMVVGTPAYMAPEQARGGELTAASDIYGLGLTLFACLTGRVPHQGDTAVETLMLRQKAKPPGVRSSKTPCPRWLDRLLRRMMEPDASDRPTAVEVGAALERGRFSVLPSARVVRRAAVVVVVSASLGAAAFGAWSRWSMEALDPGLPLHFVAHQYADSTTVDLSDASGTPLQSIDLGELWDPARNRSWGERRIAVGDCNGDGLFDAAVAQAEGSGEHFVSLFERRADGTLSPPARFDVNLEFSYDAQAFTNFRITDLLMSDLNGDGSDELILVEASTPYYPAAVRVLDGNFEPLFTLWHPGILRSVQVGDRDRDGRKELYLGGTGNFSKLSKPGSNTSMPILMCVSADWTARGQEVSLFGGAHLLAASTPPGVRIHYLAWPRIVTENYQRAWQNAWVQTAREQQDEYYLNLWVSMDTRSDAVNKTGMRGGIREIFLDRSLSPTYMAWNPSFAEALDINPAGPEMRDLLWPRYWNGKTWQKESCFIGSYR